MLTMRALSRRDPAALFSTLALAIITACVVLRYSRPFHLNPDVAAWGITFDLTITLPVLYWFFLVRPGRVRPLTIAPVFLLGTIAATALLPDQHQAFAAQLMTVVVPFAEVLLAAALIRRVIALSRLRPASADSYDKIADAARTLVGDGRVADVVTSEIAMVYYAVFGWKQQPVARERPITFHQRSGWGTVIACIFVLIAAEGLAMHLFLARWSSIAAWAWTALDLWAVIWFLGDYQALRLRRTWLDDDALHLHFGLRWNVTIPRERIASVRPVQQERDWKHRDVLKVAMLEEPRWLITFDEPLLARGLAGMRKTIIALAVAPDDDEWLHALA